tara:strand:- start:861 stop:1484 length:624 start_codon:yes stop_codon:yes gene_type:complete
MREFNWNEYQTDKINGHGYQKIFNNFLDRGKKVIVEFGCREGSAKLWCEYFTRGNVTGCDIVPFKYHHDRFNFLNLNMHLHSEYEKLPDNIDVLIDDGPHTPQSQQLMLGACLNKMAPGGVIIFEDLHCTEIGEIKKDDYVKFLGDADITTNNLLKEWKKGIFNTYKYIDSVNFKDKKLDITITRGEKIRWPYQSQPSEVIIIKLES